MFTSFLRRLTKKRQKKRGDTFRAADVTKRFFNFDTPWVIFKKKERVYKNEKEKNIDFSIGVLFGVCHLDIPYYDGGCECGRAKRNADRLFGSEHVFLLFLFKMAEDLLKLMPQKV